MTTAPPPDDAASAKRWPQGELWGRGIPQEVDVPGAEPALLALHGFGATPNEVFLLTDSAAELGLRRRAPLLPGHGTHARDLAPLRYEDWYRAAERELLRLSVSGPVIVSGQSMGSVLALDLAEQHEERVLALVVLANATRLASPYPNLALAAAERLGVPDFQMPKFGGPNIRDQENRWEHVTYSAQPIRAALSLRRAGLRVLEGLTRVHCPTLVAHGQFDEVCPVDNAWEVAQRLGTNDVELVILPNSGHIITKDNDRDTLRNRVRAFLRRVVRGAPTPKPPAQPTPVEP